MRSFAITATAMHQMTLILHNMGYVTDVTTKLSTKTTSTTAGEKVNKGV